MIRPIDVSNQALLQSGMTVAFGARSSYAKLRVSLSEGRGQLVWSDG